MAVISKRRRRPKSAGAENAPAPITAGDQYQLRAIARALDVLDLFDDGETVLSLKEIAGAMQLPESSLFRILLTLKAQGYLIQAKDGSYSLAPKILYGRLYERAERFRNSMRPLLQGLAARFDETASTAYLYGDQVRVLDAVETFQEVRMTNRPGRVLPPHCSSLGKAIVAFQQPTQVERMLEVYGLVRRTEHSIVDRHLLLTEFERIRKEGFACDRQETILGGLCIGAPIFVRDKAVAAISVSTPLVRMSPQREQEIRAAVVQVARQCSSDAASSDRH